MKREDRLWQSSSNVWLVSCFILKIFIFSWLFFTCAQSALHVYSTYSCLCWKVRTERSTQRETEQHIYSHICKWIQRWLYSTEIYTHIYGYSHFTFSHSHLSNFQFQHSLCKAEVLVHFDLVSVFVPQCRGLLLHVAHLNSSTAGWCFQSSVTLKKKKNVQVKSLKHRLTLHLSTTQHSGVTSQLKYSIKWGPGTNVAGKMMTIGQIMKTQFCENFHRAVNLINESSSLLSKNSKFAGFSIFCVSYCQLLYFLFCFKCWRKRLSLWE